MDNTEVFNSYLNESIFLDSFIENADKMSDEQLRESIERFPENSVRLLEEKVKKFKADLSKESYDTLVKELKKFAGHIDDALDLIAHKSEYRTTIEKLEKISKNADELLKKLKSNKLIAEKIGHVVTPEQNAEDKGGKK